MAGAPWLTLYHYRRLKQINDPRAHLIAWAAGAALIAIVVGIGLVITTVDDRTLPPLLHVYGYGVSALGIGGTVLCIIYKGRETRPFVKRASQDTTDL